MITHLHYDHIGGFAQFPSARFHVQDREMAYATGRHMTRAALSHAFTPDHVAALVMEVYAGRVVFHDGDSELAPGLSLHRVGGHTDGLQVVRVHTEVGWIVLASDATHYYENFTAGRPFPIVFDVGAMLEGYDDAAPARRRPRARGARPRPARARTVRTGHPRAGRHRRPPRHPPDLTDPPAPRLAQIELSTARHRVAAVVLFEFGAPGGRR